MTDLSELLGRLQAAGFVRDARLIQEARATADRNGLTDVGRYDVELLLRRGEVTVTVERNTARMKLAGAESLVQHPPVAIIAGPKGRVATSVAKPQLILSVADQLA